MRLVRFNHTVEAPTLARLGIVVSADRVADLRAAYALYLHENGDPQARDLARLRMPPAIAAFLQIGAPGRSALAALTPWLARLAESEPDAKGLDGEILFAGLGACRLHAPLRLTKLILAYQGPEERPRFAMKPPGAVIGPTRDITWPRGIDALDASAGIAIAIGARCKDASESEAAQAIAGYTAMTDVTARDLADVDPTNFAAGMFESFSPSGPALVSADEVSDAAGLSAELRVNGTLRRSLSIAEARWPAPRLIAFLSRMGLEPGDLVWVGPEPSRDAVSRIEVGDVVETAIHAIGTLRNRIVAQAA